MMKLLFHRDVLFATLFVFIVIGLLSATVGTNILEPGKHDFEDYEYTDLVFSKKAITPGKLNDSIVIINVGKSDRAAIAATIEKVNSMQPKVVGLDLLFNVNKDADKDSVLRAAISHCHNIVVGQEIAISGDRKKGVFDNGIVNTGYINFFGAKDNVVRFFPTFYKSDTSFTAQIMRFANPRKFQTLCRRGNEEAINYSSRNNNYLIFDYKKLLSQDFDTEALRNKIVLIGFCSSDLNDIEDMHYTPMNEKIAGRSLPDMRGVVIHANIISMLLEDNYITSMPGWLNLIISWVMGWVVTAICVHLLAKKKNTFHIVIRFWQILAIFFICFLDILLLRYANLKIDSRLTIIVITLLVEVSSVYEMVAIWMHNHFNYKTLFKPH